MRQVNYQGVHRSTPRDIDLQEAELVYASRLPWVQDLLEEIQGLRQALLQDLDGRVLVDDEDLNDRVAYLENILNQLGAKYDDEETWIKKGRPQEPGSGIPLKGAVAYHRN